MRSHGLWIVIGPLICFSFILRNASAQSTVCEILARNIKPDTITQGSQSQQFAEVKKLVSDKNYEEFTNAHSASFEGTLLSDYVDIFVNSKSDEHSWHLHRQQILVDEF